MLLTEIPFDAGDDAGFSQVDPDQSDDEFTKNLLGKLDEVRRRILESREGESLP